jgi:predicted signal transduction protein with EAL and GGDEF domain
MDASREHADVLLRLRNLGFRIAIDDFGTGFSSLTYLRRFPVDRIKIAQEFMADLTEGSSNEAIVQAAIALARALKLEVIVEGVETAEQLAMIRAMAPTKSRAITIPNRCGQRDGIASAARYDPSVRRVARVPSRNGHLHPMPSRELRMRPTRRS